MKKKMAGLAILVVSLLLVMSTLTLNIQPIKAEPDVCITITVLFVDDCPVEGAFTKITNATNLWNWGFTNATGQKTKCEDMSPGLYIARAYYPDMVTEFGIQAFIIDETEEDVTIKGSYNETIPPVIEILSPQNTTYATTSVPLTFTVYDYSLISWMGYSLDNQPNATITGNTTLTGLALGTHDITVYVTAPTTNMTRPMSPFNKAKTI